MWAGGTLRHVENDVIEQTPRYVGSMKLYYVYILASMRRILYIGVTGNLENRLAYHRTLENPTAFTQSGFMVSTSRTFFARRHPLSCFSRSIA